MTSQEALQDGLRTFALELMTGGFTEKGLSKVLRLLNTRITELVEELNARIREVKELKKRVSELEAENASLKAQVPSTTRTLDL